MTRPGPLYRRLGLTSRSFPLPDLFLPEFAGRDRTTQVTIQRGGGDLSVHAPNTATWTSYQDLDLSAGSPVAFQFPTYLADWIESRCHVDAGAVRWRFRGIVSDETKDDSHRGRGSTTINAVSRTALLNRLDLTHQPTQHHDIVTSPRLTFSNPLPWLALDIVQEGLAETWYTTDEDPLTASQWLEMVGERGYIISERRYGDLAIRSVANARSRANAAAANDWPLQRAHVLEPATWTKPPRQPTVFTIDYRDAAYTPQTAGFYNPSLPNMHQHLDFSNTYYNGTSRLQQLDRRLGWNAASQDTRGYEFDALTIPLDHLIASPFEGHRRTAGTLLKLEIGDPLPLGDDWPPEISGLYLVTGITEHFTYRGWDMTLKLMPWRHFAGDESPTIPPRVWSQIPGRWSDYPTQEWSDF